MLAFCSYQLNSLAQHQLSLAQLSMAFVIYYSACVVWSVDSQRNGEHISLISLPKSSNYLSELELQMTLLVVHECCHSYHRIRLTAPNHLRLEEERRRRRRKKLQDKHTTTLELQKKGSSSVQAHHHLLYENPPHARNIDVMS